MQFLLVTPTHVKIFMKITMDVEMNWVRYP